MAGLALQRCLNHPDREAAARCPECTRFFCRECITEHEDRVICAACLQRLVEAARPPAKRRISLKGVTATCGALLGLCAAWFAFHYFGESLLQLPSQFHEDTLWKLGGMSFSTDSDDSDD